MSVASTMSITNDRNSLEIENNNIPLYICNSFCIFSSDELKGALDIIIPGRTVQPITR